MKKLVLFLILLILIIGCSLDRDSQILDKDGAEMVDNTTEDVILKECKRRGVTYLEYMHQLDEEVKDWPFPGANGNYVRSREKPEESDTIVNGVGYNKI